MVLETVDNSINIKNLVLNSDKKEEVFDINKELSETDWANIFKLLPENMRFIKKGGDMMFRIAIVSPERARSEISDEEFDDLANTLEEPMFREEFLYDYHPQLAAMILCFPERRHELKFLDKDWEFLMTVAGQSDITVRALESFITARLMFSEKTPNLSKESLEKYKQVLDRGNMGVVPALTRIALSGIYDLKMQPWQITKRLLETKPYNESVNKERGDYSSYFQSVFDDYVSTADSIKISSNGIDIMHTKKNLNLVVEQLPERRKF